MHKNIFLSALLAFVPAAFAQTVLSTEGFEAGTKPTGWQLWNKVAGAATVSWNGTPAFAGNYAASIAVATAGAENWHTQLQGPTFDAVAGTIYRLDFQALGPAAVHVSVSNTSGGYRAGSDASLTASYAPYSIEFTADTTGKLRFNFALGSQTGTYSFDAATLTQVATLEPGWYAEANTRIDAQRKKDLVLTVQDASGQALANTPVRIRLERHAFPFGTALAFYDDSDDEWVKETAAKYFWAGVLENDFKWPTYEAAAGTVQKAQVEKYLDWSESQGWKLMRGHALEWGIEKYSFDQHWPRLLGSRELYLAALKTRIQRDMAQFKGRFQQYDVWNEVFHEPAIFDDYGWDVLDSAYVWARAADPTAQLYLNEYSVVSGGMTDRFVEIIQGFVDRKIPLDGIGVQCHFGSADINPADVKYRLDKLAKFNLPIVVTEFDMNLGTRYTEAVQAREYSKFMRAAFSHPAIAGIIMWGFWDDRHWMENGGVFRSDKTPKPAADSLFRLWNYEWTTYVEGTTDASGKVSFRGFPGKYKVAAQSGTEWKADSADFYEATEALVKTSAPVNTEDWKPTAVVTGPRSVLQASAESRLFSVQGREVWRGVLRPEQLQAGQVSGVGVPAGLYFLRQGSTVRLVKSL